MNVAQEAAIGKPPQPQADRTLGQAHFKRQRLAGSCLPDRDGCQKALSPEGSPPRVTASARFDMKGSEDRSMDTLELFGPLYPWAGGGHRRRDSASPAARRLSSPLPGGPGPPRLPAPDGAPPGRRHPPAGRLHPLAERGRQRRPPLVLLLEARLAVDGPRHQVVAELRQRLLRPLARCHGPA